MRNNEIETGNNYVKIGNNGLIEPGCCFGPGCCFREPVQYRCLHDHSVLGHTLFCCSEFIAKAALQQAYKSTRVCRAHCALLCTRCYPQSTTCACLVSCCFPCVRRPLAIWRGMWWHEHPLPHTPALDCTGASTSSWSRARTCPILWVFS